MNRPAGVTVSAVFLIMVSLVAGLEGTALLFADSFVPPTGVQPPYEKPIEVFSAVVFCGCALWGLTTAIGLIRMRRWARICILLIAALLVFSGCFLLVMFVVVTQIIPEFTSAEMLAVRIYLITIYLTGIALGIWWLVYFNRMQIKTAFGAGVELYETPRRPLSITVIAWHLVAFAALTPIALWIHFPALILGMFLTGWAAAFVYCVFAIIELSIGVGLLRLRPWSLTAAILFCSFAMVNCIGFAFVPDMNAKLLAAMNTMFPHVVFISVSFETASPILNAVLGLLMMALPLYYLVTRKQAFLDAGRAVGDSK